MEARHDWWVRELRAAKDGGGFPRVSPDACQAVLDYIEELKPEDEVIDQLAIQPVLTMGDIEQLLDDYEKRNDAMLVCAALDSWLLAAESREFDDKMPPPPRAA